MRCVLVAALFSLLPGVASAQGPADGYTLISPNGFSESWLIQLDGTRVHTYQHDGPHGRSSYLLADGTLLLPVLDPAGQFPFGGAGGRILRVDQGDTVLWDFLLSDADYQQHHDIAPMPNGNVLLIAWQRRTAAEAEAMGKTNLDGAEMWPTSIFEIEPAGLTEGEVVWEWHLWDHLVQDTDPAKPNYGVIAEHPHRVDINVGTARNGSWDHANAIDYDPVRDEILIGCHRLGEILVIDHSTTTEEAAGSTGGNRGRGGDILYRWGNPANYGAPGARQLFGVHGANWIDAGLPGAGNILVYNNGNRAGTANDFSSAEEIVPPRDGSGNYLLVPGEAFGPGSPAWSYSDPGTLFSPRFGSAFRMPNGNTLISEGLGGRLLEVRVDGTIVWEHAGPTDIFMAQRYFGMQAVTVLVQDFRADAEPGAVELRWRLSGPIGRMDLKIQREHGGRWRQLDPELVVREHDAFVFVDRDVEPATTYRYRLEILGAGEPLARLEEQVITPSASLFFARIYPNPFNPVARLEFSLDRAAVVELSVIDLRGRRVRSLWNGHLKAGEHLARWDGRDGSGKRAASGTYLFELRTEGRSVVRKAVLVE